MRHGRGLMVVVAALLLLGACSDSNKVGEGVELDLGDVAEQQRLGERTTTTQAAVSTTVPGRAAITTTTVKATTTVPATTAPPAKVATLEIAINGDDVAVQFEPAQARVFVGSNVTWTNKDSVARSVEEDTGKFKSGTLASGASFTYKADKVGVFNYHDGTRPYAVGRLEVIAR